MKSLFATLILLIVILQSCQQDIVLPTTPEATTRQWLKWNDNNNFKQLEEISAGNTLAFIKYIEKSIKGLEDDMETPPTIIQDIVCVENQNNQVECTYCCNEGEKETFILQKVNEQWKVYDIISQDEAWSEEAKEEEELLEKLLGK